MQFRLATYNIHRFIGRDNRKDIQRISQVLCEIQPDIVALQEVEYFKSLDELKSLLPKHDVKIILGPTIIAGEEHYGNILLSRFPVREQRKINLSYPGREERGALDVDIDCNGKALRVIATHLGLMPIERREQARILLEEISKKESDENDITLLMGDMNEWFLWGRPLRFIHNYFGYCQAIATYPSKLPVFSLDRIWCHPAEHIISRNVHKSRLAKEASDHLPLVGILRI